MADGTTVVEGKVKYREGKKWKPRWCVLKKPSPVADRLQLVLYKDVHEALKSGGKVKTSFPLDGYYGLESGFELERESNVLAIVCHKHVTLFAFDTREYLIQFEVKIRRSLGQEYQFPVRPVKVPTGSRLPQDNVKLLIHGPRFCMTGQVPPRILQCWNVADIRRFDAVDGKFCFEGGSRCGKGSGIHAVRSEQADEITEILRVNSLGKTSAGARLANNRRIRHPPFAKIEPPPPLPGLSPRLPPDFAAQLSPRLAGEFHANLSELRFTTPLVVSIDPLEEDGDGLVDQQSLSSSQGSCLSLRSCMDDHIIPASPAATVLRPRSGRDYQVVERRRVGSDSFSSSSPAPHSPACSSSVFTYERYSLPHRSTATLSLSSGPSREPSPGGVISTHPSTPSFSLSKERTTPTPVSVSVLPKDRAPSPKLFTSVENPLPLPPRTYRMCRRAQSEPSSAKTESPSSVPQSARSSPPSTPQLQNFPFTLCPEMLEPMLNYAEIDLTAAASTPPPVELTRHLSRHLSRNLSRRQKKPPVAVEYTQIDHTATSALKKAGEEHALSREEYNSLRRGSTATSLSRKNSAPTTNKDRRGFSSFSRERKLSSCSVDSV